MCREKIMKPRYCNCAAHLRAQHSSMWSTNILKERIFLFVSLKSQIYSAKLLCYTKQI